MLLQMPMTLSMQVCQTVLQIPFGHISKSVGLNVPNMAKLGLGNIPRETPLKTVPAESNPTGYATKLQEVSLGRIR